MRDKHSQRPSNAAVYIRLSREDGDKEESDSVGNQKKLILNYLTGREDFTLHDIYIDDGYSGTNFNRPAFKRMISDIEAGTVNCVIVKDLSRFGRDYIDTGRYLERYFPDRDVRFISVTDHIDSAKQAYDMLLPIKNIFNEQYARDISKKVTASVKTKQEAGEFIGAFASYGYKKSPVNKNKLVIDEYAANVVRRIFSLYLQGFGKQSIAKKLNAEGIPCPSEYKKLNGENYRNPNRLDTTCYWTYSTVRQILHNEMYIGNMVQGTRHQRLRGRQQLVDRENWIVVKATHEPIIDSETWEKTQRLLAIQHRDLDLETNKNIFSGLLKCGDCGRSMIKNDWRLADGSKSCSFYCGTYKRSGKGFCSPHTLPFRVLERIILEDLNRILRQVTDLQELAKARPAASAPPEKTIDAELLRLQSELDKIQKRKKALYEDYREELISKDELIAYREDYLKKEAQLSRQRKALETRKNEDTCPDAMSHPWVRRLLESGHIEKLDRNIVVEMIDEIIVYEDRKIKIRYNFSSDIQD
ncbi:MAG: recombinase family protein [Lachnospiraceae bacterium]|nr:recombinase family protein [Lachnospiraceae bacterium]